MIKAVLGILFGLAVVVAGIFFCLQLPVFGGKPTGKRLARIQQSPNYRDGKFQNLSATPLLTGQKSALRSTFDFLFHGNTKVRPSKPVPVVKTDLSRLPANRNWYVWLGHSSYMLHIDGKRFLVDPVLVSENPFPFGGKPFPGTDIYRPEDIPEVDYVFISHDHYDHLDHATMQALRQRVGMVITGLGVGAHLERWGFPADKIVGLDWNEQVQLAENVMVTALPARHSSGRALVQRQTLWASFLLQTLSETVYIGGDSGYDDFFAEIAKKHPRISLAVLENGQYDEDWANIHLFPDQLIRAVKDLHPHTVVSVHNSKYALAKHDWNEPIQLLVNNAAREGIRLSVPRIGEVWDLHEKPVLLDPWWQ